MSSRTPSRHPLYELTVMRVREFVREPEAVFWVIVFPMLLAFALGIAFRSKGDEPVHAGVIGGDVAAITAALTSAGGITVHQLDAERADLALRDGVVQVVVLPGEPPTYRFDPTRPESRLARVVVDAALQRAAGREDKFMAGEQRLAVVGARYIDWLIPGLVGMNIMGTSMWGVGFAIVWARSRRLLKRLAATPMSRVHYLMGQLLSRLLFLVVEVGALLVFARLVFSVPVFGSLFVLAIVAFVGALSFGALSLLIASRAKTVEAASGWMNLVMLPGWVVSGVFFSSANFPAATQPFIHALPLTALIDALRAVMLDGASLVAVSGELAILVAWTVVPFIVALRIFRWQ
jgi:ABC-2 type transport system permease protein